MPPILRVMKLEESLAAGIFDGWFEKRAVF